MKDIQIKATKKYLTIIVGETKVKVANREAFKAIDLETGGCAFYVADEASHIGKWCKSITYLGCKELDVEIAIDEYKMMHRNKMKTLGIPGEFVYQNATFRSEILSRVILD